MPCSCFARRYRRTGSRESPPISPPFWWITRTWNAVASAWGMRRAIALVEDYARRRVQFGAPLAEKPLHQETMAAMRVEKEAAFLGMLVRADSQTLRRSDILDQVWGVDAMPTERTVDNLVLHLRKLFEPDPDVPRHILTVRGVGYRFAS